MKASAIRRGTVVLYNDHPCRVLDFIHRTPGNLRAFVQVRLRDLITGQTFDHRYSATEEVSSASLDRRSVQILYADDTGLHAMDTESYEQFVLDHETVGDSAPWLEPGRDVLVDWYEDTPVSIELPSAVELEVVETAPAMRGATKSGSSKPAVLSNGVSVKVPEFVDVGDTIRVDPRDGSYLERAR